MRRRILALVLGLSLALSFAWGAQGSLHHGYVAETRQPVNFGATAVQPTGFVMQAVQPSGF